MAARLIYESGSETTLCPPLSLNTLQDAVNGFIRFVDAGGRTFVINESSREYGNLNELATREAKQPLYGRVVICDPKDIE